jgi:hypothetical protein
MTQVVQQSCGTRALLNIPYIIFCLSKKAPGAAKRIICLFGLTSVGTCGYSGFHGNIVTGAIK